MVTAKQAEVINKILDNPVAIGHMLGFDKLTDIHNIWLKDMILSKEDKTLQAHRGSYKTTCVSIALALIMLLMPLKRILFMRKTNTDITEVIAQVKKILKSDVIRYLSMLIWGVEIEITTDRYDCISTNLGDTDVRGTPQLLGLGLGASITGKHFDIIFTDDIVNIDDRISKAERERTKTAYQELQNIKNRDGRIYNTGTPWHKDDAFLFMPNPTKYDCYSTGLIEADTLEAIKSKMVASLFCANYELRHVATEDVIFSHATRGADPALVEQGEAHLDSAFYGEDFTAFCIAKIHDGKIYVYGRLWRRHVEDVLDEIIRARKSFNAGVIYTELNADKGAIAKELRKRGERVGTYHERMNKYVKITTYLKQAWQDVIFVAGTDEAFITQIEEYNENADHDDAGDSLASLIRELWKKKAQNTSNLYLI